MLDFLIQFGYPILFLLNILETAFIFGFLLPADSLLVTSGILASMGIFNLQISITISIIGAIIGDNIAYYIGRKYGRNVLKKHRRFFGIKKKHLDYTKKFFQKHGYKTVLIARFMAYIRSFVPLFAGINKMSYRKFLPYQIIGAIFWATSFNLIGYFFGNYWKQQHLQIETMSVFSFILALIVLYIIYKNIKKKK